MKYVVWIMTALVIAMGIIIATHECTKEVVEVLSTDTVMIVRTDTVKIVKPVAITRQVTDTVIVHVEAEAGDSVAIELPIETKHYTDSATYSCWVSGYEPSLDKIEVYSRIEQREVTTTINKPKRWGIGISAGYGLTVKGMQPYIGIGLSYRLISF